MSLEAGLLSAGAPSHAAGPSDDGVSLRRAKSIEGIERRAVSAEFLRVFTSTRVTADAKLAKRCTESGIAFVEAQIKSLTAERDALRTQMQHSVVPGIITRLSSSKDGSAARLSQLGRRIDQFTFDLAERKSRVYLTTRDVHREVIKEDADELRCRFAELPQWIDAADENGRPYVGVADFFVSHSWDSPWESVVDACMEHSDSLPPGATKPYYWIDIFAVNQHSPNSRHCTCDEQCVGCLDMKEDLPDWHLMQESHDVGFERVIRTTRKTLLVMEPWSAPRPPTRVWCLYESYMTLQQPDGQLIVALGRKESREMQLALQEKFSMIEGLIGRLDARNADVTVESDRTNIFGAIENLEGGFDGLNKSLRLALRHWLAEAADQLLERTDVARPRMTAEDLRAERKQHGYYAMTLTRFIDWWPGFHELLMLLGVGLVCFAMGFVFPATESQRIDWPPETVLYLLLAAIFLVHIASKVIKHQQMHQLRRRALFSGVAQMIYLKYMPSCMANYAFMAGMFVCMWFAGMYGFAFWAAVFMLALVTLALVISNPQDILIRHQLMMKAAWLYLQCEQESTAKALEYFETAADRFESSLGAGDRFTVHARTGHIQALHSSGRHDEATTLAEQCLTHVEAALACPRYTLDQLCLHSGSWPCNWMSHIGGCVEGRLGVFRRCDWLYLRACILAADQRPDADVLAVLQEAVEHGVMPEESKHAVNMVGDETAHRFVHHCLAFAAITERSDTQAEATGTPTELELLEERMNRNYQRRWRLKAVYAAYGYIVLCGLLTMFVVLMVRAEHLHINGRECSSIEGSYLGISGCRDGSYCSDENLCIACPVMPVNQSCDAVDGSDGCCTPLFLRNCPANPFNCSDPGV